MTYMNVRFIITTFFLEQISVLSQIYVTVIICWKAMGFHETEIASVMEIQVDLIFRMWIKMKLETW